MYFQGFDIIVMYCIPDEARATFSSSTFIYLSSGPRQQLASKRSKDFAPKSFARSSRKLNHVKHQVPRSLRTKFRAFTAALTGVLNVAPHSGVWDYLVTSNEVIHHGRTAFETC
jgi:hypothetical protein